MSKTYETTATLAALALIALLAPATNASADGGVSCEIRMVRRGGDVELKGIVHAAKATSGSYRFKISNSGDGGSARINQGGDFSLAAGESAVVGEASLNETGGLSARLSVSTDAGATSCSH